MPIIVAALTVIVLAVMCVSVVHGSFKGSKRDLMRYDRSSIENGAPFLAFVSHAVDGIPWARIMRIRQAMN